MFDLNENMWAFATGSPYAMDDRNYVQGSPSQYPSRRSFGNFMYDSSRNRVLLQGGENYGQDKNLHIFSDEWLINVENHTWSLISGEACYNCDPVHGEYRFPNSQNSSGSRSLATVFSQDGVAFLFG
jgi:hypothetical protein